MPRLEALLCSEDCTWRALAELLRSVNGFGGTGFAAKELILDAMGWASVRARVKDGDAWTLAGPGARRGLNRLHGRCKTWGVEAPLDSDAERRFVEEMVLLLSAARRDASDWCRAVGLKIHDVQFALCEFDKYERVRVKERGTVEPYLPLEGTNLAPGQEQACRPKTAEWDTVRQRKGKAKLK